RVDAWHMAIEEIECVTAKFYLDSLGDGHLLPQRKVFGLFRAIGYGGGQRASKSKRGRFREDPTVGKVTVRSKRIVSVTRCTPLGNGRHLVSFKQVLSPESIHFR